MKKLGTWLISIAMLFVSAVAFANTDYLMQPTLDTAPSHNILVMTSDTGGPSIVTDTVADDVLSLGKYRKPRFAYAYSEVIAPLHYEIIKTVCSDEPAIETPSKVPISI